MTRPARADRQGLLSRILPRPAPERGGAASADRSPPAPEPAEVTDTDRAMMRHALALAGFAAAMDETPVGAIVYDTRSGDILGEGFNRRECDDDPAAHAELIAIRRAAAEVGDWRLNHCTLVVTLEPCCMCAGAIVNARLGRVIFGAMDPKAGAAGSLYNILADSRLNHRPQVASGVEAEASGKLLRAFFRELRARK